MPWNLWPVSNNPICLLGEQLRPESSGSGLRPGTSCDPYKKPVAKPLQSFHREAVLSSG